MKLITKLSLAMLIGACSLNAADVDLSTWAPESYAAVSGFSAGNWEVALGGGSVNQTINGQPTIFYSDFNAQGSAVSGTIRVNTTGDDDYIGFVLGFEPGDTSNAAADYLLVDWKQVSQSFDFGPPSSSPNGNSLAGLAVSRVFGLPDADEFWQHENLAGTPATSGLTELARGTSLGGTGWSDFTDYMFQFDFGPNNLQVSVNGNLELDIAGAFSDGRLGFYNFSQADVLYSAFTRDPGSFPTDPGTPGVPDGGSTLALLGVSLMGLAVFRRRR